jgi:hypothetical protein
MSPKYASTVQLTQFCFSTARNSSVTSKGYFSCGSQNCWQFRVVDRSFPLALAAFFVVFLLTQCTLTSLSSNTCVCVCVCVCVRARARVCVCVYIYIYIYIWTYTNLNPTDTYTIQSCDACRRFGQRRSVYSLRRWSHNLIMLYYNTSHCVTIAYSSQYSNMLYRFVV